jgi:uncharacterized lipoprotein YmbA
MKSSKYSLSILLSVLAVSTVLYGCGSTRPTDFFLMDTLPAPEFEASDRAQDLTIAVDPVILPEYLDRPQIVTRGMGNSVELATFHQWAEPLKDLLLRILSLNLALLLETDRVVTFPMKAFGITDYRVTVKIQRFDGDQEGKVILQALWVVVDEKKQEVVRTHQSSITAQATSEDDVEAIVAAMNEAYSDLCREIAVAVSELASSATDA